VAAFGYKDLWLQLRVPKEDCTEVQRCMRINTGRDGMHKALGQMQNQGSTQEGFSVPAVVVQMHPAGW
jgi:hypothetical protein